MGATFIACTPRPKQPQAPVFEGDLSEWGRQNLEDFYDDDDQSITSSQLTMSSGISPRDTRPRVKPFELEAAREVGCWWFCAFPLGAAYGSRHKQL